MNQQNDIDDFEALEPVAFHVFQQRQADLLAQGYKTISEGKVNAEFAGNCPSCGFNERFTILMTNGEDTHDFDICMQCWQVVELTPIYAISDK